MPTHVALIKTGALGDVVRTTALLPGLRRLDPKLKLTWITSSGAIELVRDHPDVNRVAAIDAPADAPWRTESYDWVLNLDDGFDECRLASQMSTNRLSGGFEAPDGTRRYTNDVSRWFGMGILRPDEQGGLQQANILKKRNRETFGAIMYRALNLPGPVARPLVHLQLSRIAKAQSWLQGAGLSGATPVIGLNTGAGGRWRFKSWGEDQTGDLARELIDELHCGVVVFGGPAERDRNRRIASSVHRRNVVVAPTDFDLLDFTALIDQCDLLVTSDSLALHLALARETPIVAFFGPTSDSEIDLYGGGEKIVTPLDCRCCYLSDCQVRPHCMQSISSEEITGAVRRYLPGSVRVDPKPVALPELDASLIVGSDDRQLPVEV
jgi:heptosyltransferase II